MIQKHLNRSFCAISCVGAECAALFLYILSRRQSPRVGESRGGCGDQKSTWADVGGELFSGNVFGECLRNLGARLADHQQQTASGKNMATQPVASSPRATDSPVVARSGWTMDQNVGMTTTMLRIKSGGPGRPLNKVFVRFCGQNFHSIVQTGVNFVQIPTCVPHEQGCTATKVWFQIRESAICMFHKLYPNYPFTEGIRNSAMTLRMHRFRHHLPNTLVMMPILSVAHIESQIPVGANTFVAPPCGIAFPRPTMQMKMLITCLCHGGLGFIGP